MHDEPRAEIQEPSDNATNETERDLSAAWNCLRAVLIRREEHPSLDQFPLIEDRLLIVVKENGGAEAPPFISPYTGSMRG